MKYSIKTGSLETITTACLLVSVADAKRVAKARKASSQLNLALEGFDDSPGQVRSVVIDKSIKRLLVVGGITKKTIEQAEFQKLAKAAATALAQQTCKDAVWGLSNVRVSGANPVWQIRNALAVLSTALYKFDAQKQDHKKRELTRVAIHVASGAGQKAAREAVKAGQALDAGMALARDLGNAPPNVCNPTYLQRSARKFAQHSKVTVKTLEEKDMKRLGMGAFMSVSQGSDTPGKMIIIQYRGGKAKDAPHVLVGKGITFDTGGISLKPGPAMDEMKFDMCGAATVLGTTKAVIDSNLKLNLVTIVAAAENMPSGCASRPGDIVTTMSGPVSYTHLTLPTIYSV